MIFLHMLFGAFLVALGVIASAFADRLRGLRIERDTAKIRTTGTSSSRVKSAPIADAIVVEAVEDPPSRPLKTRRAEPDAGMATEVITALVASGYKKSAASEAAWSCTAAERKTIEGWTRAALRAASKGVTS